LSDQLFTREPEIHLRQRLSSPSDAAHVVATVNSLKTSTSLDR